MKKLFTLIAGVLMVAAASANNIQISNIIVSQPNITFTISWDNSWNTMSNINPLYPNNWDGAWVIIKYQNAIDNLWKHGKLSNVSGDHTVTGGVLQVDAVSDSMGIFLRRTNPGNGTVSATVTMKMGPLVGPGVFNFKVFGTEVVYIPQGQFQVGDGNTPGNTYFTPQDVTAARQSSGFGIGTLLSSPGNPAVPATFPMGYNAMYMMKYEITAEQWTDFLNTLTYDQQATRIEVAPNALVNSQAYINNAPNTDNDNIIKIQTTGLNNTVPAVFGCDLDGDFVYNENTDGQNVAFCMMNKADFFAFMDWIGLRPMTEMEYEKAARGPLPRVINEYAWGSTDAVPRLVGQLTNQNTATEAWTGVIVNGQLIANSGPANTAGPARVGNFATLSTGRASAGAGYYGNMDLAGNVHELTVFVDATGVAYTGINGNGALTTAGDADVANWPSGTSATGVGARGGSWYEAVNWNLFTMLSYRSLAYTAVARSLYYGGRGVRTMP